MNPELLKPKIIETVANAGQALLTSPTFKALYHP